MFKFHVVSSLLLLLVASPSFATNTPVQSVTAQPNPPTSTANVPSRPIAGNQVTTPTQPPLRQPDIATTPTAIAELQQRHKQELAQQNTRLQLLEKANQDALAQNQELQLKNDNLSVQVQVLQSERSAQMFLYGAATFAAGIFVGIVIYSVLYTRRRKW